KISQNPGFDCVLGNPPWEVLQPEEEKYFKSIDDKIANAKGDNRKKLITQLETQDPLQYNLWCKYVNYIQSQVKYLKHSNRYTLTNSGKLNTYALFSELNIHLLNKNGYAGFIVPTGIATDDSTKDFFGYLTQNQHIVSLNDFENRMKLFADVDSRFKFTLLSLSKKSIPEATFSFFMHQMDELNDPIRTFTLTKEDLQRINPNTGTTPIFRTLYDAELTKKIYQKVPVLCRETEDDVLQLDKYSPNPWGISFQRMFDMSNDSHLFQNEPAENRLALYEAKMIWHYDHRFGSYANVAEDSVDTHLPTPELSDYQNPAYSITPRYWVDQLEVYKRLAALSKEEKEKLELMSYEEQIQWLKARVPGYLFGFRDISNNTNERSFIGSILPLTGVGNNLPVISVKKGQSYLLFANFSSLIFDYIVRQKIGGTHLNFHYVKQFPVLAPEDYS
ncbi:MAG TPA: Eco57I restriction-modification methylase domain-containing protein, partial [Candidatus Cloacimonadota bacterium]|nr:Eco57I restriction-modification methylase domain-containing protein [Candidatus Cloacimonadota bacterium]